jgi:hypothetical protein
MQVAQSIQVLPAVTDQANLYVGLNVSAQGRTTSVLSSPGLTFNPSANSLSVSGSLSVGGSFSINSITTGAELNVGTTLRIGGVRGAALQTDVTTSALALSTLGSSTLVIGPTGLLTTVTGTVNSSTISAALATAATTGGLTSAVKVYNFISTVTVGPGVVRWYPQGSIQLISAYLTAGTAPSTGAFNITLNRNGNPVTAINLPSGSFNSSTTTLNTTASTTDYFTVDVNTANGAKDGALTIVYIKLG